MHRLTPQQARRIAVRAQCLAAARPSDLLELVRRLTLVQVDLTAAVAPSADLVCWSRLGSAYRPGDLDRLLDDGSLVEYRGMLRPAQDMALFRAGMADWPGQDAAGWELEQLDWVEANDLCRREILDRIEMDGPLPARAFPDTCVVPWRSSGWTNNRNVLRLLGFMESRGEVAVAGREGRERLWDLAERVYPDTTVVARDEASRRRNTRRLVSLGIARPRAAELPGEPNDVAHAGEAAVVEGVRGTWRVDPEQLDQPFRGRAAILSPLDRLIMDRKRMLDLFGFDYQLEMYKPVAERRWGYYALPILYGDRLVGKLDASTDLTAGVLRINAVHQDTPFTKTMRHAIDREIDGLAAFLEVDVVRAPG